MAVPEHTVYYLEIVTPDVEAACHLYGEAYGWLFQAKGPEWGRSFVATLPDGSLRGLKATLNVLIKFVKSSSLRRHSSPTLRAEGEFRVSGGF